MTLTRKQPQGWIDDPDDPWVGFLLERESCKHVKGKGVSVDESVLPVLLRVRPRPKLSSGNGFLKGEPIYNVHPHDVRRLCPGQLGMLQMHYVYVCRHQGRFVE